MADTYIATEPIYIGNVLAHDTGHEVPAENVERHGWHDKVARTGTAAAEATQPFDPSAHTVAEVQAHLETVDPAERERVLAAERSGKNRAGVVGET